MTLDQIDKQIIQATQAGLPLTKHPYHAIANNLGISAEQVMNRISLMQENGVIRRIGAVPNHYKLGYKFNAMTVWDILDEHINVLGERVGKLPFVSHCYNRPRHLPEWPYNMFAMVHSKTETDVKVKIAQIAEILGNYCKGQDVLYSTRILKKSGLRIGV